MRNFWLILFSSLSLFAASAAAQNMAIPQLLASIIAHETRTVELVELKKITEQHGYRVFLFGGAAAALTSQARNHEVPTAGSESIRSYIFPNQDIDLVFAKRDGSAIVSSEVEEIILEISHHFPYRQGGDNTWQARGLTEEYFGKPALVGNKNFLEQNTDTASIGLVELTDPNPGEARVRDFSRWDSTDSVFLSQMADKKIHFLYSDKHSLTSRAQNGTNPEVLAALRVLIKASQYGLQISDEEILQLKSIIESFDFGAAKDYPAGWIKKNLKKLVLNAFDFQQTQSLLQKTSVLKKLEEAGDAYADLNVLLDVYRASDFATAKKMALAMQRSGESTLGSATLSAAFEVVPGMIVPGTSTGSEIEADYLIDADDLRLQDLLSFARQSRSILDPQEKINKIKNYVASRFSQTLLTKNRLSETKRLFRDQGVALSLAKLWQERAADAAAQNLILSIALREAGVAHRFARLVTGGHRRFSALLVNFNNQEIVLNLQGDFDGIAFRPVQTSSKSNLFFDPLSPGARWPLEVKPLCRSLFL